MENMQHYRQPIVTATGIFLGFMLTFASQWVQNAFTKYMVKDIITAVSIGICFTLLLVVLFRILTMDYPPDRVNTYYRRTLRVFLIAVTVPFFSFLLIIIHKLVTSAGSILP